MDAEAGITQERRVQKKHTALDAVSITILDGATHRPWFIRDYGMDLYNPTQNSSVETKAQDSWKIGLRSVAYDGELTTD